jgi:hypothetical protein
LIPVSFESLENREAFETLSSTIAKEISVFGILSLTPQIATEYNLKELDKRKIRSL